MSKKLLAIILVISMFISCNPFVYALGTDYITQSDSVTLSILKDTVKIQTSIPLSSAKLVLSIYSNEQLSDIKILEVTSLAGASTEIPIPNDLKTWDIKAMLWRSFSDCTPLASYAEYKSVTISNDQIYEVSVSDSGDYILFKYFENPTDRYTKTFKIDVNNLKVYVNGVINDSPAGDIVSSVIGKYCFYGNIVLSSNSAEYDFNTVYVTDYDTIVVDENNTSLHKLIPANNTDALTYANSANTIDAVLYDADGNLMNWSDLKEWDVVSYTKANDGTKDIIKGWVVNDKVTGTINAKYPDSDQPYYTINGINYNININCMDPDSFNCNDSGTFYFDKLGKIVYFDITVSMNYAYIIDCIAYEDGFDDVVQMKLFTKNGEIKCYDVAPRVKIDGVSMYSEDMIDDTNTYPVLTDRIPAPSSINSYSIISSQGKDTENFFWNGDQITAINNIKAGQFITYTENSGQITSIDRACKISGYEDSKFIFTQYNSEYPFSEYNGTEKTLSAGANNLKITNDTLIMLAPAGTIDDDRFEIINASLLNDEDILCNVSFYNVNSDGEIGAIVISDPDFSLSLPNNSIAISNALPGYTTNSDGDVVNIINAYKNGEVLQPLITTTDCNSDLNLGDVFIPMINTKGEVKGINLLATADDDTNTVYITSLVTNANMNSTSRAYYYYGKVSDINRMNVTLADAISVEGSTVTDFYIPDTANIYIYDERLSNSRKVSCDGSLQDISVENQNGSPIYYDDTGLGNISNVCIFARQYNGEINDVVLYIFK